MTTMSITKALAELKLLDKKINRAISGGLYAGYVVGKKVMTGYNSIQEIEDKAKADYQSVTDLIKRRNKIKSAIVLSNALTKVNIGDKEFTVAEAIERKNSIEYEKQLLNKLKRTYSEIVSYVDNVNEEVKERLDKHLETLYGKEGKVKAGENSELIKPFLEENEAKFIDPLDIKKKIEQLENEIDEFLSEVDYVLSTSNTLTTIEIED